MAELPNFAPTRHVLTLNSHLLQLPTQEFAFFASKVSNTGALTEENATLCVTKLNEYLAQKNISKAATAQYRELLADVVTNAVLTKRSLTEQADAKELEQQWIASTRRCQRVATNDVDSQTYVLSVDEFKALQFASTQGFKHRKEIAHTAFRNEFLREDYKLVRDRINIATAAANKNTAASDTQAAVAFEDEDIVSTSTSKSGPTLPLTTTVLLSWMMTWHKPSWPLNSVALTLIVKHEVYIRFAAEPVPDEIKDLIQGWVRHVKRAVPQFAETMNALTSAESTLEDIWKLQSAQNFSEVTAMILALQYCISKAATFADTRPSAIPIDNYWRQLAHVDKIARRFKQLMFRHSTYALDMLSEPPIFEVPLLHMAECTEPNNNVRVQEFLKNLKAERAHLGNVRKAEAAGNAANIGAARAIIGQPAPGQRTRQREENKTAAAAGEENAPPNTADAKKFCNYCSVKTNTHLGKNCPWKLAGVARAVLKTKTVAEKLAGPTS